MRLNPHKALPEVNEHSCTSVVEAKHHSASSYATYGSHQLSQLSDFCPKAHDEQILPASRNESADIAAVVEEIVKLREVDVITMFILILHIRPRRRT